MKRVVKVLSIIFVLVVLMMSFMACSFQYGTPDKLDMGGSSVGERILIGLQVAAMGIGVVFVVLFILIGFIVLFKYAFKYADQLKAKLPKKGKKEVKTEQVIEDKPQIIFQIPDTKCKPNEKCLAGELEKIIKYAIQSLPENFKIAIILREFQGLSYDEIAAATNSNIGTVKSRIARARLKLQEDLKQYI